MTFLKITGILLAAVVVLLLLPISVRVSLQENWEADLRYLFFRFRLYPPKEKRKKTKRQPKQTVPTTEKKTVYPQKSFQELRKTAGLCLDILHSLSKPFKKLIKGITVYTIRLDMTVSAEEASETAVLYGQYNGYIYGATAALKNFLKIKNTDYRLTPLFDGGEEKFSFMVKARVRPITLLAAGLLFGINLVKTQLHKQDTIQSQEGQNHGTDKRKSTGAAERVQ